jgi:hypothetical protein
LTEEPESTDSKGFCYFDEDGNKILKLDYHGPERDLEFPIFPKGKQIQGQAHGNFMIPRYSGT